MAKLAGLKVIGCTGDDEKVKYLKEELGVDVAFNYKKESVWDVLKEHSPIDIYYDNVGGEQLDAALLYAAPDKARFIVRDSLPTKLQVGHDDSTPDLSSCKVMRL